jgi:hypothetical protein
MQTQQIPTAPFMSVAEFDDLVSSDYLAAHRAARDIVARFLFVNLGFVNAELHADNHDLLGLARSAIRTAAGHAYPVFPLQPDCYVRNRRRILEMLPIGLLRRMAQEAGAGGDLWHSREARRPQPLRNRKQLIAQILRAEGCNGTERVIWGQGALGAIPAPYGEQYNRMPFSSWHLKWVAGGEVTAVKRRQLHIDVPEFARPWVDGLLLEHDLVDGDGDHGGFAWTALELWVIQQELAAYFGHTYDAERGIRTGPDQLAERRLRAFYIGMVLPRVQSRILGMATEQYVWEALNLPLPEIAWKVRWLGRACESGQFGRTFDAHEAIEKAIATGLEAIDAQGKAKATTPEAQALVSRTQGWPQPDESDFMATFGDSFVAIERDGQRLVIGVLFGGMLKFPWVAVELVGEEGMQTLADEVAAELRRFGIRAQSGWFLTDAPPAAQSEEPATGDEPGDSTDGE